MSFILEGRHGPSPPLVLVWLRPSQLLQISNMIQILSHLKHRLAQRPRPKAPPPKNLGRRPGWLKTNLYFYIVLASFSLTKIMSFQIDREFPSTWQFQLKKIHGDQHGWVSATTTGKFSTSPSFSSSFLGFFPFVIFVCTRLFCLQFCLHDYKWLGCACIINWVFFSLPFDQIVFLSLLGF